MSIGDKEVQQKIVEQLIHIIQRDSCDIFEAAILFCEEHQIDTEDLIQLVDDVTRSRIKQDAISKNMVRKCVHNQKMRVLDF